MLSFIGVLQAKVVETNFSLNLAKPYLISFGMGLLVCTNSRD